jgi:hypothetical protein
MLPRIADTNELRVSDVLGRCVADLLGRQQDSSGNGQFVTFILCSADNDADAAMTIFLGCITRPGVCRHVASMRVLDAGGLCSDTAGMRILVINPTDKAKRTGFKKSRAFALSHHGCTGMRGRQMQYSFSLCLLEDSLFEKIRARCEPA